MTSTATRARRPAPPVASGPSVESTPPVASVASVEPEIGAAVTRRATVEGLTGLAGLEGELRLAGQGAFRVAEFAVAELAAALGLSEPAARGYVGQAVELRDRLPRCWEQVMAGRLPAWKARRIAA